MISLTLLVWFTLFAFLAVLAFFRPVWGVSLYLLTFFACPPFWWWGRHLADYRWNLYAGAILLAAVLLRRLTTTQEQGESNRAVLRIGWISLLILVNATLIHFFLATHIQISAESYYLLAKFVLLFFMIVAAVRTKADMRIVLLSLVLMAGYIGYEATINDRGSIVRNRLEGIGAPGASTANHFASLMVTLLPLTGVIFLAGRPWEKLAMLPVAPFLVNVVLLCNSRGAFLAALTSAVAFLAAAPKKVRKKALLIVCLGGVATWMLLGDSRIVERFYTTFASEEERDSSAAGRLVFWKAGLKMIADYPLGAGGHGFKKVHGVKYLSQEGIDEARAVHNGYINEACEWGIQGLLLRLGFVGGSLVLLWRCARRDNEEEEQFDRLLGCALFAGMAAYLVTCLFGDRLDAEWGYWMAALAVAHARLIGLPNVGAEPRADCAEAEPDLEARLNHAPV